MREVLFRGKTLNGEWIEGCLTWTLEKDSYFIREQKCGIDIEVVSKTVGQFTGLSDKNGTRIFEGDIVRMDGIESVVTWDKRSAMFRQVHEMYLDRLEVIGNIHDK